MSKKPIAVALIRDARGRPVFDNPGSLPEDVKAAYARLMTPEEIKEFFG